MMTSTLPTPYEDIVQMTRIKWQEGNSPAKGRIGHGTLSVLNSNTLNKVDNNVAL